MAWLEAVWERFVYGMSIVLTPANLLMMLNGLKYTLIIAFFAVLIGVVLGTIAALCKLSPIKPLRWLAGLYTTVIRGTPVAIQLMIIWFSILVFMKNKVMVGCIAFGINSGAYVAEIIRAGILAVDQGQMEAGRSLGLSYAQTMRYVILPQAIKNALPPLGSEFITLLKETSVIGFVGLMDLTRAANVIRGASYNNMSLYVAAVTYLFLVIILTWLLGKLERRLRKSDIR